MIGALPGVSDAGLASVAVVAAFARKSTAQPIVSVEDFWRGSSVGLFGLTVSSGCFRALRRHPSPLWARPLTHVARVG
jgi:hypothetical protein